MTRILVTGGAGYIGSHACKTLAHSGYEPVVYDNLVYGHRYAVKWGPLEEGDLLDRERLEQVIRTYRPEAAIHFAAYAYVGESVENPGKYYRNNVMGSLSLLETLRDLDIDKVVFSSTCATYGIPTTMPITEQTPQNPINPYGASKLMVERLLQDFETAHAVRWAALRYFNAAGADLDGDIGEHHDPETHLIPRAIMAARGEIDYLDLFGTDYDTPDGTCIRDYIHVADLANAHVLALRSLVDGKESFAANLGTGTGVSVREIIRAVERASGKPLTVREGPRRAGDPARLVADAALAERLLGFKARHTDLDTIVGSAWRWHNRNQDLD